ncbi:hypothetical protein N568_0110615, partial [Lactococcus garvieae TRF1]
YTSTPTETMLTIAAHYKIEQFIGEGGGIGADWNGALSFVQTKYATIAHQDDTYQPDYGSRVIQTFQSKEDLNIVFSDYYETDENNQLRPISQERQQWKKIISSTRLLFVLTKILPI